VNAFERNPQERRKRLIYYFLEERAPLEDFERTLVEAIWEEAEYFDLIQRTHIINEGWATFVEAKRKIQGSSKSPVPELPNF